MHDNNPLLNVPDDATTATSDTAEQKHNTNTSTPFGHLSQMANVISHGETKGMWVLGGVLLLVSLAILWLLGHGAHAGKTPTDTQAESSNDAVLQQNLRRLQQLQLAATPVQATVLPPVDSTPVPQTDDTAALIARQNAPTQMYALTDNGAVGTAAATSGSASTNSVLADQGAFAQFANDQSNNNTVVTATRMLHPGDTIAAGEFIQATLETAIDSDLPGMVRAVITSPVYAYMGEAPLVPAGSRLMGQYTSMPSNGLATTRVFVVWNRIITPDGISIQINSPATDAMGEAGVGANAVDVHFTQMFGTAALLSVMSATSATAGVSQFQQPNSANMYQQSISSAFQQSAQNSLGQNLSMNPTLHIYQGDAINVFVARDVDLYSVLANQDNSNSDDSGLTITGGQQ